jgi:DnaK suppressor protein
MSTILNTPERQALEAALRDRQQALTQELDTHQGGQSRVDHAHDLLEQDGDDAPQRDADREVDMARSDRVNQELGLISRALQRLYQPDFGTCADCGDAIAEQRLAIEPWAERCVRCQSMHEGHIPHHRL